MAASRATAVVWREERWLQMAAAGTGLAALMVYLGPGLAAPGAHWPLWDVRVYWWGGQQAARGGTLYAPGARYSFTYPPFAAVIFSVAARAPEGARAAVITAGSVGALAGFCALALGAAGVQRRPGTVFAASALALLTWPVAYTLHLGEINLIVAAMAGTDLLRRRDGGWWQGIATGLAAGIKLTPLIFVVFLLITGRVRAAITAAGKRSPRPSLWVPSYCLRNPGHTGSTACSGVRTGSATRPTPPTSPWPEPWPGWLAPRTRRRPAGSP